MSVPYEKSYCAHAGLDSTHPVHRAYHDDEYGVFSDDDTVLFERLILEINQAGLSWELILKKRAGFRDAFCGFDVATVAAFGEQDRDRLLADAGIIRNRLKVDAAIYNARVVLDLQAKHGSFHAWLQHHHPMSKADWCKLFKQTFKFTGGEIVGEFLMSLGYLEGAHHPECDLFQRRISTHFRK
jgi:DNA-3-methyladenine glycosylase I